MNDIKRIARAKYISLPTLRRDGRRVATPVWFIVADGAIVIWSGAHEGKVKRIRNNPRVTVAVCDFGGKVEGPTYTGTATLLDEARGRRVHRLLNRKYWCVKPLYSAYLALRRVLAHQPAAGSGCIEVRLDVE